MHMWAHVCVRASTRVQEQGEGNISPTCTTGKTVRNLSQVVGLHNKPWISSCRSNYRRETTSEGFGITPLVTGTNSLLPFPRTYSAPLSSAGRWQLLTALIITTVWQGRCSRKLFLGIYPSSPAHCKASAPAPQNALCTSVQTIYKLSGRHKAWLAAPAFFFSYFRGIEPVLTT